MTKAEKTAITVLAEFSCRKLFFKLRKRILSKNIGSSQVNLGMRLYDVLISLSIIIHSIKYFHRLEID